MPRLPPLPREAKACEVSPPTPKAAQSATPSAASERVPSGVRGGSLDAARGVLEAELSALRGKANALQKEMEQVEKEVEAGRASVAKLESLAAELHATRLAAQAAVKEARGFRRAEFDEAKSIVDAYFTELEGRVPGADDVLARMRKTLLNQLARDAITAADPKRYKAQKKNVPEILAMLSARLAELSPGAKADVAKAIDGLSEALGAHKEAMVRSQRRMNQERGNAGVCLAKKSTVDANIARSSAALDRAERRLAEIAPRLAAIEARMREVQRMIHLIDAIVALIAQRELIAEARHERKLEALDEERREDRRRDVEQRVEALELAARESREQAELEARSYALTAELSAAREAAAKHPDRDALLNALLALERSFERWARAAE